MDDMWIYLMKNRKEEWGRTEEIFNHYDRHLKIEKEREGNRVRFLDKELIWNGREITKIAFNKNKDSLKEEGNPAKKVNPNLTLIYYKLMLF